jgi:chromosome segregation protein
LFRYLQTLVVETREDASLVWEEIEKNKIKDCSLFCLEDVVKTNAMKSITFVENSSIASHFFKDLSQGNCVNSLENECVDEKGYYKDHRGVVFCSSKGEHNLFLREAELKELNKALVDLKAQEDGLNSSFRRAVDEQKELQVKRSENDILLRKSEMKHVEVNFILQTIVKQKQQYVEDNKSIQEELDSLKKECVDLKDRSKDLKETYKGVKSGIQQRLKDTESLEKQLDKMIEKLKVDQLTLESKEQKFQHLKEEYQELQHSINIFSVKEEENKRQQEKIRKDIIERSETGSQVVESLDVLKGKEDSLKIQVQESNLEQKKLEKSEKEVRIELGNYDKILNNLSSRCQGIEKELHKLEIKLAEGKSFKESLLHDLDERFQVTFESLLTLAPKLESSLEDGEKELKLLYQKVEKSGNINLAAIEEFDEVKERYEELEVQIRDLSEAKKELEAIIKELDDKSRSLFKETFEKIRLSFKKNFAILFSGGEADLSLIDSQDILQAGVDITAQPPGKQMRSITLLSGGEKCMTAIALLFALFETKAAPFCMLDEVDAPLDDANVQRFVSLVKEFMHRTQFIIITHNKLTMAAADRLYGVSMQEKGVSKLLMMSFGKEEKDVEYELIEN